LLGRREPTGGGVECLLVRRLDAPSGPVAPGPVASGFSRTSSEEIWEALMHPGQKLAPGARVIFDQGGAGVIHGEVLERHFHGRRSIRLWTDDGRAIQDVVDAIGHVPLPPYIKRDGRADDRERYQT